MNDIKISLTILVPGAKMLSEQECSKKLKKQLLITKGKNAGKPAKDKNGNPIYIKELVPDTTKCDRHHLKVKDKEGSETITFFTRKSEMVKQVINMPTETYKYFVSNEVPAGFFPIKNWRALSKKQKLEWHTNNIAEGLQGVVESYVVFED